jgi:hypothetical protein
MSASMSTSLNNLPLKTQKNIETTDNDINDPMVQDVLNEFQEELAVNNKPDNAYKQPQMNQAHPQQIYQAPPQMQNIQAQQQMYNINYNNKQGYQQYLNVDIAKKITIITIIVMIIIYSNLLQTAYEKLPSGVFEVIENYDIYIKGSILFIILYLLSLFDYI